MLAKDAFISIVEKASAVLKKEANIVRVNGKVVIVGDIHGQYYDLLNILRKAKFGKCDRSILRALRSEAQFGPSSGIRS